MPRKPNKSPCHVSGCHNWAMRAHTHCRSHRDRELGPRGGGAPPGNLNALKTGDHAHPLSPAGLNQLAAQLVREPGTLPAIVNGSLLVVERPGNDRGCLPTAAAAGDSWSLQGWESATRDGAELAQAAGAASAQVNKGV